MALTKFPIAPAATASAIATATADATASALEHGDIAAVLRDILLELKVHTYLYQQAFNILDDAESYRRDPDNQL